MLDKAKLKDDMKVVFLNNIPNPNTTQVAEVEALASGLADAIDTHLRGLEITYTTGLNGQIPVTGMFGYTLN